MFAAVSLGDEPIIYVTKGMELRLQCNSTGGYERNTSPGAYMVPPEVEWFKVRFFTSVNHFTQL